MADLSLDLDKTSTTYNDLLVVNGDLVLNSGTTAIQQHILQRIRTFLGEWFLDQTVGVPWFQQILGKPFKQSIADAALRKTIQETPGVVALRKYSAQFDPTTRSIPNLTFEAQATTGKVDYSGLVGL